MYRRHLLEIAEEVFAEHGYEGAKMQEIAQSASVSLSTLYNVFGNKEAIHKAVHSRRLSELFARLNEVRIRSEGEPLLVRSLAGTAAWIHFHMDCPNYLRMHLREGNAWTSLDTLQSAVQREAWQRGFARNARVNRLLMDEGWLREDDPELVTRMAVAMQQVRLAVWVEEGMKDDHEAVVEYLLESFLRSFAASDKEEEAVESGMKGYRRFRAREQETAQTLDFGAGNE
jgi:AcrR family transcriptional regulator